MLNDIFQKFTVHCKNALKNALGLALSLGHKTVSPSHIFYGLLQEKGSISGEILAKAKINGLKLKQNIDQQNPGQIKVNQIDLAPNSKKLVEKAVLLASLNKHKYIGTEHLLAALLEVNDQKISDFLNQSNIDLWEIRKEVEIALSSTGKFSDILGALDNFNFKEQNNDYSSENGIAVSPPPLALDLFATNLTDYHIQKGIDPVIGRQEEIGRLIQILSRRHKNNPILLGDPGVGKTAIVEGLAKKILQGEVPEFLINKKIYTLDLSSVVAGTSFRGEFENRLRQIIFEIKKNPNIILFIDELHNIIGAGSAVGSMDAANILKPVLARGEIRCIGATTLEDYKKHIESDPALERRFQPIIVNQPTVPETVKILLGIKENYEVFHQVRIQNDAILTAAQLSERYLADRFLPDKAIDLIDEASAAAKIKQGSDIALLQIKELENLKQKAMEKKEEMVKKEKFNLALTYKKQEEEIAEKLNELKTERQQLRQKNLIKITKEDITQIIAKITGIPLSDLIVEEKNSLLQLEKTLAKKIIGQKEALKTVAEFIRRSRLGITSASRPIGSFIFLGPSGVGKTELAKVLAESVFNSQQTLVRIDMSEFAESFNISKLIGAPAGYVGYKEGAKLTDAVKRRPYSVVLFDEIEKAHSQVFNLFLQILEDGQLTDALGKKINFRNTIIIMTSNIGSEEFNQQAALGFSAKTDKEKQAAENNFQEIERQIIKKLKNKFPPEFLNRLDKIVVFKPLTTSSITKIAVLQLNELKERLAEKNIKVEFSPALSRLIAKISYSPEVGARAVRKTIQDSIESQIAHKLLSGNKIRKKITLQAKGKEIIII